MNALKTRLVLVMTSAAVFAIAGCGGSGNLTSTTSTSGTSTGTGSATPPAGSAVVDFGTSAQVIRGFGGSEAWSGVMPQSQINALYGTASGDLGLSIMRVRIAPTTWNSSTETADTSAWTAELTNAENAQLFGATIFATPWSPPASMKSDDSTNEGYLNTSSYADYANYLEAYVNYASSMGVNLYAISMQNEPDWNPCDPNGTDEGPNGADCYESCLWTAAQMDAWTANNASVLTTRLMMPESYYYNFALSDTALNDPAAVDKIAIIGGHLYGGSPTYYKLAKTLNKDTWMTEHTINLAGGSNTSPQTITDAIDMAEEIHNSMVVAQYNAYVYWWMVNSSSANNYLIDVDSSGNYQSTSFIGSAMEQFARFVRPGYNRYSATPNPVSGVYVSAYAGNGHNVIVAINANATDSSVPFYIQNAKVSSMTPYQTTATTSVAALSAVNVQDSTFTYTLPAQSITTFVQ